MIGSAFKKLAKEHAMTVSDGVAYGFLKGYATTLSEGAGYKQIDIVTQFTDPTQLTLLQETLNRVDIQREYRVQSIGFTPRIISINFLDNPGTMKKLTAFIEWFYPLLATYGATGAHICVECGAELSAASWYLIDGVAFPLHNSCADRIQASIQEDVQKSKEEDTGSYVQGLLGALLGSALGAAVWAIVLYAGYVASLVGLLIGWLANKGYTLFHGKKGKGKIAILILAIIFGVLLGTIIPDVITLVQMINAGELPGYAYGDIPKLIVYLLSVDEDYSRATISNIGMGLLFAALGVFALLKNASKEISPIKFKKLN